MMAAVRTVTLTPKQQEVAALVAAGLTNAQVARRLNCSVHTVRAHLRVIALRLPGPQRLRYRIYEWASSAA